jgi:hypothetical protein
VTPVFPLGHAYLPGEQVGLNVFEPRYLQLFADMTESGLDTFVTVLIERGSEVGGGDRRFTNGVAVRVLERVLSDTGLSVRGVAVGPVRVTRWGDDDPYPCGEVVPSSFAAAGPGILLDAASALTVLAQTVRSMLARHGVDTGSEFMPGMQGLAQVAGGHWFSLPVPLADVERAFWSVARCIPCGPLDRHAMLSSGDVREQVSLLRRVAEHTDEILSFRAQDGE